MGDNGMEEVDVSQMDPMNVYISHTSKGRPALLLTPDRMMQVPELPGWVAVSMKDERELFKFAAQLMNKGDAMQALRESGHLPPLQ